jgi:hypothetical protein
MMDGIDTLAEFTLRIAFVVTLAQGGVSGG